MADLSSANRGDSGVIIKFCEDVNNIKVHKAIRTVVDTQQMLTVISSLFAKMCFQILIVVLLE